MSLLAKIPLIRRLVTKRYRRPDHQFPHECYYCRWFYKDSDHLIKTCHLPRPLTKHDFQTVDSPGLCGQWRLADDAHTRSRTFY